MAAMLLLLTGGSALAHSDLVRSDPVDGGAVDGVTRPVTLVFGEEFDAGSVTIRLIGSTGFQTQLAPPTTMRTVVVQALPTLINDEYVLRYGAVASDGHPVRGSISFTVTGSVVGQTGGPAHGQHTQPPTATGQRAAENSDAHQGMTPAGRGSSRVVRRPFPTHDRPVAFTRPSGFYGV